MKWMLSLALVIPAATFLGSPSLASGCSLQPGAGASAWTAGITCAKDGELANPTSVTTQTASNVAYAYEDLCERRDGAAVTPYGCVGELTCGSNGEMQAVYAYFPDGRSEYLSSTCVEPGETVPAEMLTPGRILEAFRQVPLPSTPLKVQPPGGRTLVNLDTILHTDARPFTESVQLLNRTVTFDIEPNEFTWTLGDDTSFTTDDPGRQWREGLPMSAYVSHRYARAGDVDLRLTTTWSARWRVANGPWRPVQGTVQIESPPVSLEVVTARPQLISYD